MENRILSTNLLNNFELKLRNDEKSESTIQEYKHDTILIFTKKNSIKNN